MTILDQEAKQMVLTIDNIMSRTLNNHRLLNNNIDKLRDDINSAGFMLMNCDHDVCILFEYSESNDIVLFSKYLSEILKIYIEML